MPAPDRAFVFDLDGVLVDTARLVTRSWLRYAAGRHHPLTGTEVRDRLFGRRTVDILQDEFRLSEQEARTLVEAGFDDKAAEVAAGPPLIEVRGATAFVRAAIADGRRVALVSSASSANVRLALRAVDLADAFPVVVDAGRVPRGKPSPDPYLAAADALAMAASDMVVLEDSVAGIDAALTAGAWCVAVASSLPPERLGAADLVIADFEGWAPATVLEALPRRPAR
jgi:beta-phosphoglucomutase-like phosphatase (HAD superfamily)